MAAANGEQPQTGGCQCGAVRYELSGAPVELYVCHCRECQKQSASAFGISVIARREDFRILQGGVKSWSRPTDSGRRIRCMFCPQCGSRVWHEDEEGKSPTVSIKGGSFDRPIDLTPAVHIWTKRKLVGIVIPERAAQLAEEPERAPDRDAW
jgi:hypothetical protein